MALHNVLLASAESWLTHNSSWLTPLSALAAAVATVGAVAAAIYVGVAAGRVARSQKTIAGLAELNKVDERMGNRVFLEALRGVAHGYLSHTPIDRTHAFELLDLMDQVFIYCERDLISISVLTSLYSGNFICWWYALRDVAETYRAEAKDPPLWIGAEELVREMQAEVKEQSPDWASDPPDEEALRTSFTSSLEQTERAISVLQASGGLPGSSTGAEAVGRHSRGRE